MPENSEVYRTVSLPICIECFPNEPTAFEMQPKSACSRTLPILVFKPTDMTHLTIFLSRMQFHSVLTIDAAFCSATAMASSSERSK